MNKTIEISRLLSLAMLFAGSASVVFVAVVLVKAAKANGVPVGEAAFRNAPAFISFSKVAVGAAIVLLFSESASFASNLKAKIKLRKSAIARYVCSCLCGLMVMVFGFALTPPMEKLLPEIKVSEKAHEKFHGLHETSRAVFGASILFALAALVLSTCEAKKAENGQD